MQAPVTRSKGASPLTAFIMVSLLAALVLQASATKTQPLTPLLKRLISGDCPDPASV